MLGTIHVILHPLLVLTADQDATFRSGLDDFGTISVINLDEEASASFAHQKKVVEVLAGIRTSTSRTLYAFSFPQFFAGYANNRGVLLSCAKKGTLQSITLNQSPSTRITCLKSKGHPFAPRFVVCVIFSLVHLKKILLPRNDHSSWLLQGQY